MIGASNDHSYYAVNTLWSGPAMTRSYSYYVVNTLWSGPVLTIVITLWTSYDRGQYWPYLLRCEHPMIGARKRSVCWDSHPWGVGPEVLVETRNLRHLFFGQLEVKQLTKQKQIKIQRLADFIDWVWWLHDQHISDWLIVRMLGCLLACLTGWLNGLNGFAMTHSVDRLISDRLIKCVI